MYDRSDKIRLFIFGASAIGILMVIVVVLSVVWPRKDETSSVTGGEGSSVQPVPIGRDGNAGEASLTSPQGTNGIQTTAPINMNINSSSVAAGPGLPAEANNNGQAAPGPLLAPPPPPPPPVDMNRLKKQGCVADGLLTEYSPENAKFIDLINRSNCYYLHRAIETWLNPPDFEKIKKVKDQITKKDVVYGMFIAEAIDTKETYYNEKKNRDFDFSKMCHKGSDNYWGEHTCRPAFSSEEYRDYVQQISRHAIDQGVQSFMFGQIYWQEGSENHYAKKILKSIRDYAKESGVDVILGAQTGSITDADYLKLFDYIEGGVGINGNGDIEQGSCSSKHGSCWALLWNKAYASKAKNVLLHLDWTGIPSDDLDIFARMSQNKRARTLQNLYSYFTSKNMGFMMPFFGVLDRNNGGCYGPRPRYYSPDNAYTCKDEDVINKILGQ